MITELLSAVSDVYTAGSDRARDARHMGYSTVCSSIAAVNGAFQQAVCRMQYHPHARPMPTWVYAAVLGADSFTHAAMHVECELRLFAGLEQPTIRWHQFQTA